MFLNCITKWVLQLGLRSDGSIIFFTHSFTDHLEYYDVCSDFMFKHHNLFKCKFWTQ